MKDVKPYNNSENKKTQIINMFDSISETYDLLNLVLSFRMDYMWRIKSIQSIKNNPKKILDIATGTADFAIMAAKYTNAKIIGVDISKKMLSIGNKKIKKYDLSNRIILKLADAEQLPFKNNSFQAITSGFGVRNFQSVDAGLSEMYRVLDKDGAVVILEPSKPSRFPFFFNTLYNSDNPFSIFTKFLITKPAVITSNKSSLKGNFSASAFLRTLF